MSLIPRVYRSTDPGAPQLYGQPGSFAAIMDAVLVDGYGGGADFKAPLGWTRAFTGTNKRVYRNDPELYSGGFIRFEDSNARYVLVDAYAQMTGIDAGTERYEPTSVAWAKADATSTATRKWVVVGTGKCFYVFVWPTATGLFSWGYLVGDLIMFGPNDIWCFAYSRTGASTYTSGGGAGSGLLVSGSDSVDAGTRVARPSSGLPGGQTLKTSLSLFSGQTWFGSSASGYPYPLPTTNGTLLSRVILNEGGPPRATLPGLWIPEHVGVHANDAVYTGFEDLPAGTELLCLHSHSQNSNNAVGRGLFDITNPW